MIQVAASGLGATQLLLLVPVLEQLQSRLDFRPILVMFLPFLQVLLLFLATRRYLLLRERSRSTTASRRTADARRSSLVLTSLLSGSRRMTGRSAGRRSARHSARYPPNRTCQRSLRWHLALADHFVCFALLQIAQRLPKNIEKGYRSEFIANLGCFRKKLSKVIRKKKKKSLQSISFCC